MSLSEEYLREVRERVGAATEGPWAWASHTTADGDEWAVFDPADHALASNRDGWAPDAEFIAHARSDVPVLVAEVDRLREGIRVSLNDSRSMQSEVRASVTLAYLQSVLDELLDPTERGDEP